MLTAALIAWLVRAIVGAREPAGPSGRVPQPGEFWFIPVPYQDGTGVKDRPALVLSRRGHLLHVAPLTSTDKSQRNQYLRVDTRSWDHPGRGTSWLDTSRVVKVEAATARRRAARAPLSLWVNMGLRHPWLVLAGDKTARQ